MKRLFLPVLFAAAIFSACDVIEPPYKETTENPIDTTKKYVQKVLIEDYTGFYCGNCPAAAEQAKVLHETYKDRVVVMGVHAGFFAKPKKTEDYDFRTTVGTELDNFFGIGIAGNPNGMINRTGFSTKSHIASVASWSAKTSEALAQEPVVGISLKPEFNSATKTLSLEATAEFLKAAESDAYLAVYLVEDSVIQFQLDYRKNPAPNVPDFVHMHVLRGAVNSTWGDQLSTAAISSGAKFTKNYIYTIPEGKDWKPEHMKIIAYVHRYNSTYEVLNVEEVELME
jgi:hypothetical protein